MSIAIITFLTDILIFELLNSLSQKLTVYKHGLLLSHIEIPTLLTYC